MRIALNHVKKMKPIEKLLKAAGGLIVIFAALVGLRYLLVSTRPPKLKAWESCKVNILENWAASHPGQVKALLHFTQDHLYSFGGESPMDHFDDHDSRGTAVAHAGRLGISETELIQLDQRIARECGSFPRD
ncbi:MAG: hypothetical protein ABSA97_08650 [Verrucomicrobiia bacterium]